MIVIPNTGLWFVIGFAVVLLSSWLMGRQSRFFFTKDPLKRKFSIMEMEFPAKSYELERLINGIYALPDLAARTIKALRTQLLIDYLLFIPAAYGCIFLLCMYVAGHTATGVGTASFTVLAWAQAIPFVLDYLENTYFWILSGERDIPIPKPNPLNPPPVPLSFRLMRILEVLKWGIALVAAVCALSAMAYFWLSGKFVFS